MVEAVAQAFNVGRAEVLTSRPQGNDARTAAIYLARRITDEGVGAIGRCFGDVSMAAISKTVARGEAAWRGFASDEALGPLAGETRLRRKVKCQYLTPVTPVTDPSYDPEGHREGLLEEDAREMIEGVIELGDADVAQIMTPRTDMVSMSAALPWSEMLDLVIKMGHTRIPVYGRSRDDIIGILYAKDLLPELAKPPEGRVEPWTKLLREPVFVPETKPINALLQELQGSQNHMAVVLDEYGGVSGLVTMEDVLEEIVGEIVDEYDTALVDGIRDVGPGVCEALGRVHLDEINERLGLDLPEDAEYDTIAGYVFSELGHIPVVGEQLLRDDVRITVLEATRRRIERLRIEVLKPSPSE